MKVAGQKLLVDGAGRKFGTIKDLNFAMEFSRTGARILGLVLGSTLLFAAALVVASCQVGLAQGDADLEAPGLAPFATPASPQPTLLTKYRATENGSS